MKGKSEGSGPSGSRGTPNVVPDTAQLPVPTMSASHP